MMTKKMLAFHPDTYEMLQSEAKRRDVTIQELIRAVIIPDWARMIGLKHPLERARKE
jgi:hypothetical protein